MPVVVLDLTPGPWQLTGRRRRIHVRREVFERR
jgi:hypothetical protein